MTRDVALLRSILAPTAILPAGRLAAVLILAALLVGLLVSALIPMLSVLELSPTRWYQLAV